MKQAATEVPLPMDGHGRSTSIRMPGSRVTSALTLQGETVLLGKAASFEPRVVEGAGSYLVGAVRARAPLLEREERGQAGVRHVVEGRAGHDAAGDGNVAAGDVPCAVGAPPVQATTM